MEPTTGASSPPPPPIAPAKKKTSPLVWILVGCLGLFVIGGIMFAAVGFFAVRKATDFASDFAENPIRKSVEAIVALNPDLELVSSDDEAQTMTIKNLQTGEVATFDWSDIQNGSFSFEADGKEYTIDGSEAAAGRMTVQDESGEQVMSFGAGSGEVPPWFPQYPGSVEVHVLVNATQNGQESRIWTFQTGDPVADVLKFYDEALKGEGWEVTTSASTMGGIDNGSLDAKADSGARSLNLVLSRNGAEPAQAMVTYTGPPSG